MPISRFLTRPAFRRETVAPAAAIISLAAILAGGCASPLVEDALSNYQCEREASNRPDAQQRKAECHSSAQPPRPPSPD